jgi:DNA excision repair protein ERCC-2
LEAKQLFFADAACGVGKSIAALATIVSHLGAKNKLAVLVRTRDQSQIYMKELKALKVSCLTVALANKQVMCQNEKIKLFLAGSEKRKHLSQQELEKRMNAIPYSSFLEACENWKEGHPPTCEYYCVDEHAVRLARHCAECLLDPVAASIFMAKQHVCAYEALRHILADAKIFLGTYHYVFNPVVNRFFSKDFPLEKTYLIVDEAHNLPQFARNLLSKSISSTTVEWAIKEVGRYAAGREDALVVRGILELMKPKLDHLSLYLDEGEMAKYGLVLGQMEELCNVDSAQALISYGYHVKRRKRVLLRPPHSLCLNIGEYVKQFYEKQQPQYFHAVEKKHNVTWLRTHCLDGRILTDSALRRAKGAILMSGTFSPIEVYRNLTLYSGADTILKTYGNPFPKVNRLILAANGVTTQFRTRGNEMDAKIVQYLQAVLDANKGNVAVFFTSYASMMLIESYLRTNRRVIVEDRKNTKRSDVVSFLKENGNNLLLGVMGGKLSEGIDYPENVLTCVVVVGLPLAGWSSKENALIHYFSGLYPGKGPLYAYYTPGLLRLVQTAGRIHRSAEDRGCIVLMDDRVYNSLLQHLPSYMREEMKFVETPEECQAEIGNFWKLGHAT